VWRARSVASAESLVSMTSSEEESSMTCSCILRMSTIRSRGSGLVANAATA